MVELKARFDEESNIECYSKLILDVLKKSLSNPIQSTLIETTVNAMPAKLTTLNGKIEGIDAFYSIGIYEGKERYYQVFFWPLDSFTGHKFKFTHKVI